MKRAERAEQQNDADQSVLSHRWLRHRRADLVAFTPRGTDQITPLIGKHSLSRGVFKYEGEGEEEEEWEEEEAPESSTSRISHVERSRRRRHSGECRRAQRPQSTYHLASPSRPRS
jgi:hypothetical protein